MTKATTERLGPWTAEDVLSIQEICKERASLAELRAHPVYRWFRKNLPRAFHATPRDEFGLVLLLTGLMAVGMTMAEADRTYPDRRTTKERQRETVRMSKRRAKALKDIRQVQSYLTDGAAGLPPELSSNTMELDQLLGAWCASLARRRAAPLRYPVIGVLAGGLLAVTGSVDVRLVMDWAALCGLPCDERTAQRYVSRLRGPRSAADQEF